MDREQVMVTMREVAPEVLGVAPDVVVEEANFKDDLDADSLDLVELVMGLEERLDVVGDQDRGPGRRPRGGQAGREDLTGR